MAAWRPRHGTGNGDTHHGARAAAGAVASAGAVAPAPAQPGRHSPGGGSARAWPAVTIFPCGGSVGHSGPVTASMVRPASPSHLFIYFLFL